MKDHQTSALLQRLGGALALALPLMLPVAAQAQGRFSVGASGNEVLDNRTGLTWRRCAEGLTFNGVTCTGAFRAFTHGAALAYARDQVGWRLPNVKELHSLVDNSRVSPTIDSVAFPATPEAWFWTSTPFVPDPNLAWVVIFRSGGGVYVNNRESDAGGTDGGAVRLVRIGP